MDPRRAGEAAIVAAAVALAVLGGRAASQDRGHWRSAAPLLSDRTEVTGAGVGDVLYVIGGFGEGGERVEAYHPRADRWERRASLPVPVHHAAAVAVGASLFVVGGYSGLGWGALDSVYEYLPAVDRWRTRAPLPTARGALAAAVIDGRIYAVGGVGRDRLNTGALEVFDPAVNRWEALASMPTPRDHHAAAAIGGRLYVVGGRLGGSYARNLDTVEVYDARTDGWGRRAAMPTARSGVAAAVLGSRLYVFGGESPAGTFKEVEAYDPVADRWLTQAPMPTPRHGLAAIPYAGRIYVLSGGPHPGGSFSSTNEVFTPPSLP